MRYVIAGYVIVLALLFFYGAHLVWRRRRLDRAVARVATFDDRRVPPADDAGAERG